MDKLKDLADTWAKVIKAHLDSVDVQIKAFPDSKYWQGQHDAILNLHMALIDLAVKKNIPLVDNQTPEAPAQ